MSEENTLLGLNCPKCGGIVPIPEGQVIVCCPYCNLRSFVKGDRGLRRYQVAQAVDRARAAEALGGFLSGNMAIAMDASRQAKVTESFLAYLPFWAAWGRVMGWAFGQVRVGSRDHRRYEAREIKIVEEMSWNGAACDVGEFGVNEIPLTTQALEPFNPEKLHAAGLVFEPAGSFANAQATAETEFEGRVRKRARLDRLSQLFVRSLRRRFGLVYYPLWVLRYSYRGRVFQVVVDGHSGKVLYGKAPGNTLYRAAVLVGGMALGAFLSVDASSLLFYLANGRNGSDLFGIGLVLIAAGFGLMAVAYRAFRYGEQYEYRSGKPGAAKELLQPKEFMSKVQDIEQWINQLN
ncbi:MAG: hypothetical protein EHM70_02310 [Chloroflexota bacterium]|nr:MAG: hypothetical protein EHM70_02310 [Chloroflexota bacterium]